jgi:uncharacterized protein
MSFVDTMNSAYIASGFAVGFLVGVTGVGGGSLMTPVLVILFGIDASIAVGTDLLHATATKTVGSLVHNSLGTVDWRITRRLATGSIPATLLTLVALYVLGPTSKETSAVITGVLGGALLLTAACAIARPLLIRFLTATFPARLTERPAAVTICVGAVLGVLVSISSVGAGAIGLTALIFLYPHLPMVRLVGTDIAHAVPLTLVAGLGHWLLGAVDGSILVPLLIGSIPGIAVGSLLASRVPEFVLRPTLATTLAIVGIRLLG